MDTAPASTSPSDPPSGVRRTADGSPLRARFAAFAARELRRLRKRIERARRARHHLIDGVPFFVREDVTQTALAVLWERIDGVPPASWASWMRTAVDFGLRHRRRAFHQAAKFEPQIAVEMERELTPIVPDQAVYDLEVARGMERLIASLDGPSAAVARLHLGDEISLKEAAEVLGVPASTVRTWWQRARAAMLAEWRRDRAKGRRSTLPEIGAIVAALLLFVCARLFRNRRPRAGALFASAACVAFFGPHNMLVEPRAEALPALVVVNGQVPRGDGGESAAPGSMEAASRSPGGDGATEGGHALASNSQSRPIRTVSAPGPFATAAPRTLSAAEALEADHLLRLASALATTDPSRAMGLLDEHRRRFGDRHAVSRADALRRARAAAHRAAATRAGAPSPDQP